MEYRYNCTIVGPEADKERIPGIDVALKENDVWKFGDLDMHVYDTPGHTRGHITLYFPEAGCLFPGESSTLYDFEDVQCPLVLKHGCVSGHRGHSFCHGMRSLV